MSGDRQPGAYWLGQDAGIGHSEPIQQATVSTCSKYCPELFSCVAVRLGWLLAYHAKAGLLLSCSPAA